MVGPLEMDLVVQSSSSMALIGYILLAEAEDNHYQKLMIQLARLRDCRVAASASVNNHDYLRSLGAELAVDYREADWVEQVRRWAPDGVDAALAIQPKTGADCMRTVRNGGKVVTVSGDQLAAERQIAVKQFIVGDTQAELAELAQQVASGHIHVEIEQVYPFEQGIAVLEKTEAQHARGKVVLRWS